MTLNNHESHRAARLDRDRSTRRFFGGFTLVELLVVIVLIGILSGMTAVMLSGVRADAREKKAQRLVDTIEQILAVQMNELSYGAVPMNPSPSGGGAPLARLIGKRDQLRMVFPDRRGDLLMPPARIIYAAPPPSGSPIFTKVTPPSSYRRMRAVLQLDGSVALNAPVGIDVTLENVYGTGSNVKWYGGSSYGLARRSASDPSTSIIPSPPQDDSPSPVDQYWTRQYESAECLYLILKATNYNGTPAIETLGRNVTANVDGDLVPEIVDPWGVPLMFIRWPVGFPSQTKTDPDPFDFLQKDPRFTTATTPMGKPFRLTPLVISAGLDSEFGIFHSPKSIDPATSTDFAYAENTYTPLPSSPPPLLGRFPDPYINLQQDMSAGNDTNADISAARYNPTTGAQGGGIGSIIDFQASEDNVSSGGAQ